MSPFSSRLVSTQSWKKHLVSYFLLLPETLMMQLEQESILYQKPLILHSSQVIWFIVHRYMQVHVCSHYLANNVILDIYRSNWFNWDGSSVSGLINQWSICHRLNLSWHAVLYQYGGFWKDVKIVVVPCKNFLNHF